MVGNRLREDVFLKRLLLKLCKEIHTSQSFAGDLDDLWFLRLLRSPKESKDWNVAKNMLKGYFEKVHKIINVPLKNNPEIMEGHYIESLYFFERSVFWFFNYKHNLDPFNQVASEQALYYSEFFSIVALSRFLGGSLTHTPLDLFKININWEINSIQIKPGRSWGAHKDYTNLFFELLDSIDCSDYEGLENLKINQYIRSKGFLMKKDREENVYTLISRMSDPFKNSLHADFNESSINASRSLNFLNGSDELSSTAGIHDYEGGLAEYLYREYKDDGYRQHYIGEYWKFMTFALKEIRGTEDYIKNLIWKINRFEECASVELDKKTKDILIKWLTD